MNYSAFAASLEVSFEAAIGEEDTLTVTAGTIFDTAFTNHLFIESDKTSDLADGLPDNFYLEEAWGPKQVKALYWPFDPASATYITDLEGLADDLQDGYVWGYASLPIGVQVDVSLMGISATVAAQTRLVNGKDVANPDKGDDLDITQFDETLYIPDWVGPNYEPGTPRDYAMPISASVDASYDLALNGISVAPTANFKFCSDFAKVDINADGDAIEYLGDVVAADYMGRAMSVAVGVDVTGIADMVDVSISGGMGLGFGSGSYDFFMDGYYNAVDWPGDITGMATGWNGVATAYEKDLDTLGIEPFKFNNMIFGTDASAYGVDVTVTANVIDNLTLANAFSYDHDGLGFTGAAEALDDMVTLGVVPGSNTIAAGWVDQITNTTDIDYDFQVAGSTACTFYGDFTLTKTNFFFEQDVYSKGWDSTTETFRIWDSEESTKMTLDYEVGVMVTVSLD
jgi:hypothetical protein